MPAPLAALGGAIIKGGAMALKGGAMVAKTGGKLAIKGGKIAAKGAKGKDAKGVAAQATAALKAQEKKKALFKIMIQS